jgi:hypothetical protein
LGREVKSAGSIHQKCKLTSRKNNYSFMSWTLYDFPQVPDQVAGNGLGKKK